MNITMDVREKLVQLLKTNACPSPFMCDPACRYYGFGDCFPDRFADHLIAHGATVTPIKVGDTVYTNLAMRGWYFRKNDRPYSARVCFVGLNDSEGMGGGFFNVVYGKHENMMQFRFSDIGKSVFISKEEAEAHLPQPPKG